MLGKEMINISAEVDKLLQLSNYHHYLPASTPNYKASPLNTRKTFSFFITINISAMRLIFLSATYYIFKVLSYYLNNFVFLNAI